MNKAAIDCQVLFFCANTALLYPGYDFAKSYGKYRFNYMRNCQTIFQGVPILFFILPTNVWEFQLFCILTGTWYCCFPPLFILAINKICVAVSTSGFYLHFHNV